MRSLFRLLSILLILTGSRMSAQAYESLFGSISTSWDIAIGYCDAVTTESGFVIGDTIINAKTYKILGGFQGFSGFAGYIREDTLQGKAWFYNEYQKQEYLAMDLNLSVGDTFNIYDYGNTAHPYLVDSVYSLNNRKHVRLNVSISICTSIEQITFIEGVGTNAGLFFQGNYFDPIPNYMLCQHKNGSQVASNLLYPDTCFLHVVHLPELKFSDNKLQVFPNPAHEELNIELNMVIGSSTRLSVYNELGERIFSTAVSQKRLKIDIARLPSGIYTIVIGDSYSFVSGMFIKQ